MFITRKRFEEEIHLAEKRAYEKAYEDQRYREIQREMFDRFDALSMRISRLENSNNENP